MPEKEDNWDVLGRSYFLLDLFGGPKGIDHLFLVVISQPIQLELHLPKTEQIAVSAYFHGQTVGFREIEVEDEMDQLDVYCIQ